ncbi:hypothetical protein C7446_2313 [Kushneria sinocarnis]|uniref:Minor tail protein Z (GPZ) n=1 Tax=Kushneria sinocarnis TaxID=595502 RepID=A0A420WVM9_9GAMM|nr:phage tail protein [Kushneria sinocarnis]RKR02595.1 hypothetical protein C7446_2313 [Kushneria sinocarnis]
MSLLDFEIDDSALQRVVSELGAAPREVRLSYNRALSRTAATLRKMSSKGLQSELGLRRATVLRRRIKSLRAKQGKGSEVQLWYGLNDLPVSEFKGKVHTGEGGASYAGPAGSHRFPNAFAARSERAGRRTIMRRIRQSRLPITEERLPIKDRADVYVEDEIFHQLEDIFWRHFRRDLEARVRYLRSK